MVDLAIKQLNFNKNISKTLKIKKMKIKPDLGTKERLFELMKRVDKKFLNEALTPEMENVLDECFNELKEGMFKVEKGGKVETSMFTENGVGYASIDGYINNKHCKFNFKIEGIDTTDDVVNIDNAELIEFSYKDEKNEFLLKEEDLQSFNKNHSTDEIISAIEQYMELNINNAPEEENLDESKLIFNPSHGEKLYSLVEEFNLQDSQPFGGSKDELQNGMDYADEKPINPKLRVKSRELEKVVSENAGSEDEEDIDALKRANYLIKMYKNSNLWSDIIGELNKNDVDYNNWSDIDMILWYLEHKNSEEQIQEDENDNLISFTVPDWAVNALIYRDDSNLTNNERNELDAFEKDIIRKYGNAHFIYGEKVNDKEHSIFIKPTKNNNEQIQESKDNLIDFIVPDWALGALINDDYSGLSTQDANEVNAFKQKIRREYGNTHFLPGDFDGEDNLGFQYTNDIDNNGTNVYRIYLQPTKNNDIDEVKNNMTNKENQVKNIITKFIRYPKVNLLINSFKELLKSKKYFGEDDVFKKLVNTYSEYLSEIFHEFNTELSSEEIKNYFSNSTNHVFNETEENIGVPKRDGSGMGIGANAGRGCEENELDKQQDIIHGGLGDNAKPSDFDKDQLLKGIEIEMEHTDDPRIALEIAMDHLTEIPDYYTRLGAMEKEAGIDDEKEETSSDEKLTDELLGFDQSTPDFQK